jgi:hypothetical protein
VLILADEPAIEYDPYEEDRYEDHRYDDVDPELDEACADVRHVWREHTGEKELQSSLPESVVQAAAEVLAENSDIVVDGCDDDGNPESGSFVWKMTPLEALARVRPRLVGAVRPNLHAARCRPRDARRPQRSARTRRTRRVTRTASSPTRDGPDDPEPAGGRRSRPLADARAA